MTLLVCPECCGQFVAHGDVAAEYIVHEWVRQSGAETYRETAEDILHIFGHEYDPRTFVEKCSGLSFLNREVSTMNLGEITHDA